jgi:hypothetical protein
LFLINRSFSSFKQSILLLEGLLHNFRLVHHPEERLSLLFFHLILVLLTELVLLFLDFFLALFVDFVDDLAFDLDGLAVAGDGGEEKLRVVLLELLLYLLEVFNFEAHALDLA